MGVGCGYRDRGRLQGWGVVTTVGVVMRVRAWSNGRAWLWDERKRRAHD